MICITGKELYFLLFIMIDQRRIATVVKKLEQKLDH